MFNQMQTPLQQFEKPMPDSSEKFRQRYTPTKNANEESEKIQSKQAGSQMDSDAKPQSVDLQDPKNVGIFQAYVAKFGKTLLRDLTATGKFSEWSTKKTTKKFMKALKAAMRSDSEQEGHSGHSAEAEAAVCADEGQTSPNPEPFPGKIAWQPKGILNVGNSCYSACILQILLYQPKFVFKVCKFRVDSEKRRRCSAKLTEAKGAKRAKLQMRLSGAEFIESLQGFVGQMIAGRDGYVDPSDVFSKLVDSEGKAKFADQSQEDALEFLDCVFKLVNHGMHLGPRVSALTAVSQEKEGPAAPV